jgi:hypothetical protein
MSDEDSINSAIRQILLTDWDPHDAARNPAAHGTYDHYIDPLIELIRSGDEQAVVRFLQEREAETMCFPALGTRRLIPVARKLLALGLDSRK